MYINSWRSVYSREVRGKSNKLGLKWFIIYYLDKKGNFITVRTKLIESVVKFEWKVDFDKS